MHDLNLHIGLLTEHKVTCLLQMLDAIRDKPGIVTDPDSDLAQLKIESKPQDVLAEIQRLQDRVRKYQHTSNQHTSNNQGETK